MVRVLIAEEMPMIRGALAALLSLEPDMNIVAEVGRRDLVTSAAIASSPHVAILNTDGIEIAPELRRRTPDLQLLVLSATAQPRLLRQALSAQVSGFILKEEPPAQLAEAVRKVAAGERIINPKLALKALDADETPLTARELEVLRLFSRGFEPTDIAGFLSLQVGTVRNYLTSIVTKLAARNRVDAIRIASRVGWL
ncbi:response regulator transcription factor [Streptomyces resistomycificus]|uniref:MerR family transcriptional regulator n=1 Tax=Streptomyces resistomycificus TaxID=67356 RepID=A0A0L8L2E9_9ACTN|nr:response regulator transcription factor [Streptomyces resistomycificus]KOG32285.1 MerR family transcriptional regulator [Streptomyces resistomycificus]KUN94631.1 two-component system response regulator [Streptomyces resistomycificus]